MGAYKPGQGSLTRLITVVTVVAAILLGCRELYSWIQRPTDGALVPWAVFQRLPGLGVPFSWKFLLCVLVFIGLTYAARLLLVRPATVDTLIETESELKKVTWPTKDESLKATWIVVFVTVLITIVLFVFDIVLQAVLRLLF